MEMKQLLFFRRTAELEHMTRAAEQLMVAQPFLSKTIAALEDELGVPLFDHVGRQIRLNDYGRAFYARVQRIFLELEDAQKELDDLSLRKEQEVSIVTNASLYMPGLLSHFRSFLPDAQFHQRSARRFRIIKMLSSGEADFAICSPPLTEDPELETITLIHEICPVIYPPGHWLEGRRQVDLKELKDESFISALPGYAIRDLAEGFFQSAEIHPKIIVESSDTSSIPNYIRNGFGVAFSPLSALLQNTLLQDRHIRYIEVEVPPCIGVVGLTWKKDRYLTRVGKQFRDFAAGYFASVDPQNL